MLRASTACTFSTSQLPKVLRTWDALYTLTSKCAPRRNCVQFFISHLTRWVRTRRFSEPTYHWKNIVNRDFSTFSRTCIFFLLTLSLPWSSLFCPSLLWFFPPLLFHLSIWSEVWLLNFLRSCKSLQDPGCPGWHWAMQGKSWGQGKAHKPDHSQPPRRPDFFCETSCNTDPETAGQECWAVNARITVKKRIWPGMKSNHISMVAQTCCLAT